jgi:hypothetical protein
MLSVAGLIAGATLAVTPAASAAPLCVGTQSTFVQCVDPTGGRPIQDCIYVGPPPCIPVSVPTPYVYCLGGDIGSQTISCGW